MLHLITPRGDLVLRCDDYYIRELATGLDEVIFSISIHDPVYPEIVEEAQIRDRNRQTYLIKQIDGGDERAGCIAHLDLDDWRAEMHMAYGVDDKTVYEVVNAIKPEGWTVVDNSGVTGTASVNGNLTSLEICQECSEIYGVWFRWNNADKICTIVSKVPGASVGAFVCRDLNLREINYKGKSTDLFTRIYAVGQDGLTFADINDGKSYVDNHTYTDKVLPYYWEDESYTSKEALLEEATRMLEGMAMPARSYDCSIVDLQAADPERYGWLDFSIFTSVTLVDDVKDFARDYMVVERMVYPYYPEKNEVILDTSPARLTNMVQNNKKLLEEKVDPAQMQTEVDRATGVLQTGRSGYVVIGRNADGYANEIYVLDTNSLATATKVLRINNAGIGFSSSGAEGPYYQAWTLDGILSLGGVNNAFGTLHLLNPNGDVIGTFSAANGLEFTRGQNVGFKADGSAVQIGDFYVADEYGRQILQSSDQKTGMSGEPNTAGKLYLWAGYQNASTHTFVVNNQGVVEIQGTLIYNGETLDNLIDGAYNRGYSDGYSDGYADGQQHPITPS